MAVRVLLLIAVTGLFATAWSSDRPEAATRRLAAETRPLPDRPSPVENAQRTLVVAEVGRAVSVSAEFDVSVVLLPELISSGTYRVVDAQGRVAWMSIPLHNHPERAATEPAAPVNVLAIRARNRGDRLPVAGDDDSLAFLGVPQCGR